MADDPNFLYRQPPTEDDSESLSFSHALHLSKYLGPIRLSRLEVLEPEIAHALVGHRGRELSLPAVRLLSPEVAGLLASYDGQLHLDGLWLLDSIPLAEKLAGQWKAQGVSAAYPNVSVEVAEALDLWPPPSLRWPPGKTYEEGAKLPMFWAFADKEKSKLSHAEQQALEKWQKYSTRRSELADDVRRNIKKATGVDLLVDEVMGKQSLLAPLVEAEKRFCTAWLIREVVLPQDAESSGWYYINEQADCVGPITFRELEAATDRPTPHFYWQMLDGPGPKISDIQLGPGNCLDSDSKHERAALACLLAAERYRAVIRELLSFMSDGTLSTYDIDSLCHHYQKLDVIVECGFELWPALRSIPHVDRFSGRSACVGLLNTLLDENSDDLGIEVRRHVKKWIRRLGKP